MIVYENHIEKKVNQAKFMADVYEILNTYQDISDIEARPSTQVKQLALENQELHFMYDTIYYGLITQDSYPHDKAQRLLNDVRAEVTKMYKGNVQFIFKQTNLVRNCLEKFLKPKVAKILENYNTSISSKNLNMAFQKVDEVKQIAGRSIQQMAQNMQETEELMQHSQEINVMSKDFQKNSEKLETMMINQNFWMCSKKCIAMFVAGGILLIIIWNLIDFGGSDEEESGTTGGQETINAREETS